MNNQSTIDTIDFQAVLWPDRGPSFGSYSLDSLYWLNPKKLPGWPWSPHDTRALQLIEAVAKRFATSCREALRHASSVARALAGYSPDYHDPLKEQEAEKWCQLTNPAFHAAAIRNFREELDKRAEGPRSVALVAGLLHEHQPLVIGGPQKSMKTSVMIELAAALTTGGQFLGLTVPEPVGVFAITLEKPLDEWLSNFAQSVETRGGNLKAARARLAVSDSRDWLRKKGRRAELARFLQMSGTKVASFDPIYAIQPTVNTADLVAMGKMLRYLVKPIVEGNATPVFVHHFNKSVSFGARPTLGDLNGAGVGPFVGSWILVNRERAYTGGKVHNLLAVTGTSSGDCASLKIRFDEASWKVEVRPGGSKTIRDGSGPARTSRFLDPRD